jgi:hypothetical protein
MEKSLNLLIQDFEDGLIAYVNSAPIPIKSKLSALNSLIGPLTQANISSNAQERAKLKTEEKKEGAPDGETI